MSDISRIRNFCIIAHIDHGKSTLADRLLEVTGTLAKRDIKDRVMDTLELEQERGITIKLQTARMLYDYQGQEGSSEQPKPSQGEYVLNLIDTPGHVDFSYEVSRSVAASEGALLLVDATQGVQAQTLSTYFKALEQNLAIIPVINKVDMDIADVDRTKLEMMDTFGFKEEEIILASGKSGIGVKEILDAIVERVPAPRVAPEGSALKALIYDSFFHEYKGVVALVKVEQGKITNRDKLYFVGSETVNTPIEVGYLKPVMVTSAALEAGEVGYVATGLKDIRQVHVGDTITHFHENKGHLQIEALPGYQPAKPMVFASLYPVDAADFSEFQDALEKLALNDAAISYQRENSQALGTGFVCGFLGLLHLEIVQERLEREFDIDLISTSPTVEFRLKLITTDYTKIPRFNPANLQEDGTYRVRTAADFPETTLVDVVLEPWVKLEIFTPEEYVGGVMELCQQKRGVYKSMEFLSKSSTGAKHAVLVYEIPSLEIMVNFFDQLKSLSHGYASMDYSFLEYRPGDIVKVDILINQVEAEALSFLAHRESALRKSRTLVEKLAEIIPRQQFSVPIQAAIGGNILARADVKAYRKDVTAKLYGGDETRKMKLLNKQKKGKKKMKAIGKVEVPKEVFMTALRSG